MGVGGSEDEGYTVTVSVKAGTRQDSLIKPGESNCCDKIKQLFWRNFIVLPLGCINASGGLRLPSYGQSGALFAFPEAGRGPFTAHTLLRLPVRRAVTRRGLTAATRMSCDDAPPSHTLTGQSGDGRTHLNDKYGY